jgi:hypothetical protein
MSFFTSLAAVYMNRYVPDIELDALLSSKLL